MKRFFIFLAVLSMNSFSKTPCEQANDFYQSKRSASKKPLEQLNTHLVETRASISGVAAELVALQSQLTEYQNITLLGAESQLEVQLATLIKEKEATVAEIDSIKDSVHLAEEAMLLSCSAL